MTSVLVVFLNELLLSYKKKDTCLLGNETELTLIYLPNHRRSVVKRGLPNFEMTKDTSVFSLLAFMVIAF